MVYSLMIEKKLASCLNGSALQSQFSLEQTGSLAGVKVVVRPVGKRLGYLAGRQAIEAAASGLRGPG